MKSWLLSSLKAAHLAKGKPAFLGSFTHGWLLWEPGSWTPPQRRTMTLPVRRVATAGPEGPVVSVSGGGEALAIALLPEGKPLVLGRAEDCDLIINDATLSGRHLAFHPGPAWAVEDLHSTNGSRVAGAVLSPAQRVELKDGAMLQAGQALLTYLSSEGLWSRLAR